MRRLTIHTTLGVQFDADQVTKGPNEHQVEQALDIINLALERQDQLNPQIFGPHWDDMPEITEEVFCNSCGQWYEIGDDDEGCPCKEVSDG